MAKFGTILFGTDPIKYAEEAGPGAVLSTKYNYEDGDESGTGTGVLKSITDPFGKDYSFQRLENGSRTLYPNNTFTDRTYDQWGRLETIAHKRRETGGAPAGNGDSGSSSGSGDGSGEFGSETLLQSFTYQYDNSGNITKITEANGEYIDYYYGPILYPPMNTGTDAHINAIRGLSESDIFAVGQNGTILHYDGSSWSSMASGTTQSLNGVFIYDSDDVYAVGDNGTILHYDGSAWSSMTSGTTQNLNAVSGYHYSSYWGVRAVGDNGTILYYYGNTWQALDSGITENLNGVLAYFNKFYIVGDNGKIYKYTGTWTQMESGTTEDLLAIWGNNDEDDYIYAVGKNGTILKHSAAWSQMESGTDKDLYDVWGVSEGSSDFLFAAGENGALLQCRYSTWQEKNTGWREDYRCIWIPSKSEAYMGGMNGILIDYTGTPAATGSLNRLLQEHRKTSAGDTIYKIEYTFDDNSSKNGNIHRVVYDGKHVTEFTYNEMNELTGITHPDTSTETLTYDNNGNLTQTVNNTTGETTTYEWDCFDRLTKVTMPPKYGADTGEEISFTYNGDDELIRITYPDMTIDMKESKGDFVRKTAKFRFNGQKTPSDVEMSSFDIYVMGQLLCKYNSGPDAASTSRNSGRNTGEARFYHYDHNNNLALTTDQYGNIVEKPLMDAYGNILPVPDSNNPNGSRTLSTNLLTGGAGIFYLSRAKKYNMRRRSFSQSIYRFISPDPSISDYIDYLYAYLNPVMYSDPSGLITIGYGGYFPYYSRKLNGKYTYVPDVMNLVVHTITSRFKKALKKGSADSCFCAFKKYCKKAHTDTSVRNALQTNLPKYDISFYYESTEPVFPDDINGMTLAYTASDNLMYLLHLLLGATVSRIAKTVVHEMAHQVYWCNIPGNELTTKPASPGKPPEKTWIKFFKDHACCDLIAAKCGFQSNFGKEYQENMKNLWSQLEKNYKKKWGFPAYTDDIKENIKKISEIKSANWEIYGFSDNKISSVESHCAYKMKKE